MGAALVLLLVGLGAMAAGVLIGRYYVPDDRQLRRTARHSKAYMRALSHLVARDHDTVISELRNVVEENVEDAEPYFALGAIFRSRGSTSARSAFTRPWRFGSATSASCASARCTSSASTSARRGCRGARRARWRRS